jgi:hypothetical protein
MRGLGTIVQTPLGVEREVARGDLVFIPLSNPKLQPRRLILMTRPKAELSEAASALSVALALTIERLPA